MWNPWNGEGERTRGLPDRIVYPRWLTALPEDAAFSTLRSNYDPQHQHPAQWSGQAWEPAAWDKVWSEEVSVRRLFEADVFRREYRESGTSVIELGPRFYQISDLDRRRALKLFVDSAGLLRKGNGMVALRDWRTGEIMGSYTSAGMNLK